MMINCVKFYQEIPECLIDDLLLAPEFVLGIPSLANTLMAASRISRFLFSLSTMMGDMAMFTYK